MKRYDLYSKRDPAKNFSPLPNEVFYLGLSYGAIAVYGYLMHIEDLCLRGKYITAVPGEDTEMVESAGA